MKGLNYAGYVRVTANGRRTFEHVIVAERVLGRPLPKGAVVHHVNDNKADNRPCNLVILQNQGHHNMIHARLNALRATGDVNKRPCRYCHQYDDCTVLKVNGTSCFHRTCHATYHRNLRRNAL